MKHIRSSLAWSTCLLLLLGGHDLWAQARTDIYLDPSDQRRHATVTTEVYGSQLHIRVSSIGLGVDALPGFRGRAGANMQTAFEINQLLMSDRLELVTYHSSGALQGPWTLQAGPRGSIPERRISCEGEIDYHAMSEQSYWLSFRVVGVPLKAGIYRTEMWSRGEPRLRIDCAVGPDGRGEVVHFEEIPHGLSYPKNAGELFRFVVADEKTEPPYKAPTASKAWAKLDMDAKWINFKQSTSDGALLKDWVHFLKLEKDYTFIEWVALYELDAFNHQGLGEILANAGAPNWLRLTHWLRGDAPPKRGHGWTLIDGLFLAEPHRNIASSWILTHHLEDAYPSILAELQQAKAKKVNVAKFLPPFPPNHFTQVLTTPPSPKDAKAPEAAMTEAEVNAVLRGMDAIIVAERFKDAGLLRKLAAMRLHPHERIRQVAFLTYTHFPVGAVPLDLLQVVKNEEEPKLVREAALLAHSYRHTPEIYPDLLDIAQDPAHPAWKAAVSRLGELGDRFALQSIQTLTIQDVETAKHAKLCATEIEARLAAYAGQTKSQLIADMLRRAAWMQHIEHTSLDAYLASLTHEAKTQSPEIAFWLENKFQQPVFITHATRSDTKRIKLSVKLSLILRELAAEVLQELK